MSNLLATVVICTRNRAKFLEKAVRSVLAQADERVELLIVDNGSTDDTPALAKKFAAADPRVKFLVETETGLSRARNTALKNAKGEWVIFFDDDAVAEPGWLAAYENFFLQPPNKKAVVVGGAVTPEFEIPLPRWISGVAQLDLGSKPFCFPRGNCPWECNFACRREQAVEFGGFDARLGHRGDTAGYREGVDLNLRLQEAGYESWWLPGAGIRHFIHARRMNLRWLLAATFNEGRTVAIQRLKYRAGGNRALYAAGRLLAAPFHCALNLFVALVSWPFQHGRTAVKALSRAASVAGLSWELLLWIFRGKKTGAVGK
jgi:glycosyltransferase involved in cell wall biosynthesis